MAFVTFDFVPSRRMAFPKIICLLAALALADGCKKQPEPVAAPPPPPAPVRLTESTDAGAPPPPPPTQGAELAAPAGESTGTIPAQYQLEGNVQKLLMKYYAAYDRPAMSWEDLLTAKLIPAVPRGPDGKPLDWDKTMQRIGQLSDPNRR